MHEWAAVALLIGCASLMPCAAGTSSDSNVVDIFNVTSGKWSTAALSSPRFYLAATSLPNLGVAIFAGGRGTCFYVDFCIFACFVFCALGNRMLEWAAVALLITSFKSHALCSGQRQLLRRCGHLQRDVWNLEHCSSQRSSTICCSHIAAESRSRDIRRWFE
jgi:hypothetical protein